MHVPYLKSYHPVEHPLGQGREIAVHPVAQGKIGQHPKPHGQNQTSMERLPRRASAGERQDDRRDGRDEARIPDEHEHQGDAAAYRVVDDVVGLVGRKASARDDGPGLEPGRLLREPGQHEGAGGDPCDEDRDGDNGEQNEECGHTGVGSVKLEATRGFGGLHMGSAAQAGITVGGPDERGGGIDRGTTVRLRRPPAARGRESVAWGQYSGMRSPERPETSSRPKHHPCVHRSENGTGLSRLRNKVAMRFRRPVHVQGVLLWS